jgi:hypothetical protein
MPRVSIRLAAAGSAILLCGILAALAVARPIYVQTGEFEISFDATIKPKTLPRSRQAPIAPHLTSNLKPRGGSAQFPVMTRATILIDRAVGIDSGGVPTCTAARLENQTTANAEPACRGAIVGSGMATVQLNYPEAAPATVRSRLIAFNGGLAGNATTILVHAYLEAPVAQAIVVPVVLTRHNRGPYGVMAQINFPKIASGAGSLASVDLTFKREVRTAAGRKHGYLTGRCSDGNFVFEPTVEFEDGNLARGVLALGCDEGS